MEDRNAVEDPPELLGCETMEAACGLLMGIREVWGNASLSLPHQRSYGPPRNQQRYERPTDTLGLLELVPMGHP